LPPKILSFRKSHAIMCLYPVSRFCTPINIRAEGGLENDGE